MANEIIGEESVVVPAGTFIAYKVESNIAQKMMASMGGSDAKMRLAICKSLKPFVPLVSLVRTLLDDESNQGLLRISHQEHKEHKGHNRRRLWLSSLVITTI